MEEYTNLEKAIIASSLINTIFSEYVPGELNRSSELVRSRIAKFMRKRSKSNKAIFLDCIMTTDKAWRETISHFAKDKIKIEAKSTIAFIYNQFSSELEKFANVQDKHIEKMMIDTTSDYEAEINSDKIMEYLLSRIGIETKRSAFSGKKLILKGNIITDGKKLNPQFL